MARDGSAAAARPAEVGFDGDEPRLVAALRRRDEAAFVALVRRYHSLMLRVAYAQVKDRAACEEVVQETWLAVIEGIDQFEGRSSLRTWMFRILSYRAYHRVQKEGRLIPFSMLAAADAAAGEPSTSPSRFLPRDHPDAPYHWTSDPTEWPESALLAAEARGLIVAAIDQLPNTQRVVITLRDVEGWSSDEVCEALNLSDGNQRVLLHRARSSVRAALEEYLET